MKQKILTVILISLFPVILTAQQGASVVRDYVGLINQSYHPSIVSYFEKAKKEYEKHGERDTARAIDAILKGGFGSGFLYSDARGNFYVITNNHVVSQAHSLSITFERVDGTKTKIDNLRIIATDVESDMALLAFPPNVRPLVNQGLTLLTRQIEEGEEVFSAGFPGLGSTPLWQFGNGRISNASARFPKSRTDETLMGPFIQHTAQIDSGNSGGPLLVAMRNAPSGYAVVGINTLKAIYRQAANYAIPLGTLRPFLDNALNPKPDTFRAALDDQLTKFTDMINNSKTAVYTDISEYLSAACIGENAEFAFEEMFEKANRTIVRTFIERSREDFIEAMGIAIGWTIENSIRKGTTPLRASVKEVNGSGEEYNVIFTINNSDVNTVWIREYGNWRIKSFGTIAAGDQRLIEKRDEDRLATSRLHTDSFFRIDAGYAYLFEKAPVALYATLDFGISTIYGVNFYFVDSNMFSIGPKVGWQFPFNAGKAGFMPYIVLGFNYTHYPRDDDDTPPNFGLLLPTFYFEDKLDPPLALSLYAQTGLRFTTSAVPGLYGNLGFIYNLSNDFNKKYSTPPFKMGINLSVGYAVSSRPLR